MASSNQRRVACAVVLCTFTFGKHAVSQSLHTINPPSGGAIVYGQVAGQSTEAGAMGAVLRSVHQNIGEKPQVGKLFQVRGTQSVATFFSATRRNGNGGQVAGLLIVTKVSSDAVEAGLVTDDANRFNKTLPQNLKTLFSAWHPFKAVAASTSPSSGGPVASMQRITLPDNSASVSLPDSWKVVPNLSAIGTIVAANPEGANAFLNVAFLAMDTNNPQVRQSMPAAQSGRLGPMYAQAAYIPYGADPARSLVYLFNKSRAKGGMPAAEFNITNVQPIQGNGPTRCAHLEGTVDFKDQRGTRELNGAFCEDPPGSGGTFLSAAYLTTVPSAQAAKERATLGAILASFNVNQAVVRAQANRMAAPAIAQIHAIGEAAAAQAKAAHERNDIQNSSVYQRWDSMDKRSQEFENYQLGYSVLSDNVNNAHETFWNEDADAIVRSNPNQYEYVNAPNYWKGIDY